MQFSINNKAIMITVKGMRKKNGTCLFPLLFLFFALLMAQILGKTTKKVSYTVRNRPIWPKFKIVRRPFLENSRDFRSPLATLKKTRLLAVTRSSFQFYWSRFFKVLMSVDYCQNVQRWLLFLYGDFDTPYKMLRLVSSLRFKVVSWNFVYLSTSPRYACSEIFKW